jgi:hypothetical protein
MKRSWLLLVSMSTSLAQAHPGHGMPEPAHWHASDVLGFVAVVAVVAGLLWWRNRK